MANHGALAMQGTAQDAYRQQVFGSAELSLNLDAVRARVLELYRTLEQLLVDLQARGGQWGHLLDKLAVVNVQHMAILQQLRPLTRNFVLHPKAPSTAQALAQHAAEIPILLTSKVLPEQEAEDAAHLAACSGGLGAAALGPDALQRAEDALGHLRGAVAYLVTASMGDDTSGVLDSKQGTMRRAIDATSRDIQRALAQQAASRGAGASRKRGREGEAPVAGGAALSTGVSAEAAAAQAAVQQQLDALLEGVISGATLRLAK